MMAPNIDNLLNQLGNRAINRRALSEAVTDKILVEIAVRKSCKSSYVQFSLLNFHLGGLPVEDESLVFLPICYLHNGGNSCKRMRCRKKSKGAKFPEPMKL